MDFAFGSEDKFTMVTKSLINSDTGNAVKFISVHPILVKEDEEVDEDAEAWV